MAEHTGGPFRARGPSPGIGVHDDGGDFAIIDDDNQVIFEAYHKTDYGVYHPAKNNARRLVTLWKACDGISTEALEAGAVAGLVEALGSAKYVLMNKSNADMTALHKVAEGALVDIDDALAALEPEPDLPFSYGPHGEPPEYGEPDE